MIHDPLQLRTGKIGVDQQAGFFRHRFSKAVGLQPVADLRRPAALPHNGIVHRLSCPAVPQDRRLPLVGDTDAGNGLGVDMGGVHRLGQRPNRGGPDLHGIVLHPSRLREDLPEGILGLGYDLSPAVEQNGPGGGGPLIQCSDIGLHWVSSSGNFQKSVLHYDKPHFIIHRRKFPW